MERMKQTVITVNTIRPIQIGEPAGDRRSLSEHTKQRESHRQNTMTNVMNVSVVGDSMFQKGQCVNTRDLCGQNMAKPCCGGVTAAIRAMKWGNAHGAKGGRKTNGIAP